MFQHGGLAQLVERVLSMHEVGSSILPFSMQTSWPSGLRRCVKAAVFLAWVRIPPKSTPFAICISVP